MHGPVLRQHLPFTTPHSFFRGFGGLGQGLGIALGMKLAAHKRPVTLLIGDGGFLYNPVIQALGASKNHNLPILIVVFNNKGYMAMQKGHVHHYPDGAAESANMHLGSQLNGSGLLRARLRISACTANASKIRRSSKARCRRR